MEKMESPQQQQIVEPNAGESEWFTVSDEDECGNISSSSGDSGANEKQSRQVLLQDSSSASSVPSLGWPIREPQVRSLLVVNVSKDEEKQSHLEEGEDGFLDANCDKIEEYRKSSLSSSSSDFLTSEATGNEEHSGSEHSSSPAPMGWPVLQSNQKQKCQTFNGNGEQERPNLKDTKHEKQDPKISDIQMMKERFSKLLLGEDMSGRGEGVCTALAISNAITNLCATVFGQIWRLEPLQHEKKSMWRREMEWLLCVSDYIVEFLPSWQTFPDGSKLEVMTCRPRSDLYVNLPALRKLDHMLLEILDSFKNTEFWYVDQGIMAPDANGSVSFRRPSQRQEEKWWLPVPCVPTRGLHESSRKQLQHRRECTNQILKAAMAINSIALDEMEVPESYLESLPKNGKASLGDVLHRYITSDQFSPECLLDCLTLSSEHQVLEIANRIEAASFVWRQRANSGTNRPTFKSSWEIVKELMVDHEKWELLAERAESLLLCLKQRYTGLPQTTLDMSKIQYNKDVGKSILESYSRVLESLASNIMARIDDLFYVDDLAKHSDQFSSVSSVSVIAHKRVSISYPVPASTTAYAATFTPSNFYSASPVRPFIQSNMPPAPHGLGIKKDFTEEQPGPK